MAILVGISLILSIITGIALYSLVSLSDIDKEVDGIIIVALVFTGIEFIISVSLHYFIMTFCYLSIFILLDFASRIFISIK